MPNYRLSPIAYRLSPLVVAAVFLLTRATDAQLAQFSGTATVSGEIDGVGVDDCQLTMLPTIDGSVGSYFWYDWAYSQANSFPSSTSVYADTRTATLGVGGIAGESQANGGAQASTITTANVQRNFRMEASVNAPGTVWSYDQSNASSVLFFLAPVGVGFEIYEVSMRLNSDDPIDWYWEFAYTANGVSLYKLARPIGHTGAWLRGQAIPQKNLGANEIFTLQSGAGLNTTAVWQRSSLMTKIYHQ